MPLGWTVLIWPGHSLTADCQVSSSLHSTSDPAASVYKDTRCHGVQILITDRQAVRPLDVGLQIATVLCAESIPDQWRVAAYDRLLADQAVWSAVQQGRPLEEVQATYAAELREFRRRRAAFLLYPE